MRSAAGIVMVVSVLAAPGARAAGQRLNGLELQQIQARAFEVPKALAFAAVMTVLQDAGFRIVSADKDTGFITGIGTSESHVTWLPFVGFGSSKKNPVITAFIEERGPGARIRLNFVMAKARNNNLGALSDEDAILDPAVYRDAFEKIEKEIFFRQAEDAPISAAVATGASTDPPAPLVVQVVREASAIASVVTPAAVAPPVVAVAAHGAQAKASPVAEAIGIPVFEGDILQRYRILGPVKVVMKRETAFLDGQITSDKAHAALWKQARKLKADAVIHASLGKPHQTLMNYQEAEATGVAIAYAPDLPSASQ